MSNLLRTSAKENGSKGTSMTDTPRTNALATELSALLDAKPIMSPEGGQTITTIVASLVMLAEELERSLSEERKAWQEAHLSLVERGKQIARYERAFESIETRIDGLIDTDDDNEGGAKPNVFMGIQCDIDAAREGR